MRLHVLFIAALLALGTTACSKDEEGSAEGEGAEATEAAEAAAEEEEAAEEGTEGGDRLVGTWVLDEKTVKEMMEKSKKGGSKDEAAEGMGMAMVMAMSPTFQFNEDGTMSFTMSNPLKEDAEPKTEEGTYKVTSVDGDKMTLETTAKGEVETLIVTFDGDDKVTLSKESGEAPMHLRRKS